MANLPVANDAQYAEPFTAAVADVKIKVGGYSRSVALKRRGRTAREKRKPPLLLTLTIRIFIHGRKGRGLYCEYPLASIPTMNSSSVNSRNGFLTKLPPTLNTAAAN